MKSSLKKDIAQSPKKPGVYLFKDKRDRILYVGKASNLRDRLHSYIAPENPKIKKLAEKAAKVEYIVTGSDAEALILEENLIKLNKPKYNVRLKDDKKYPYLKITVKEKFPRIFITRDVRRDGNILFGPYTSVRTLKKALHMVKKIFGIRGCKYNLPDECPERPCLYYQLNLCSAPCTGNVDESSYKKNTEKVVKMLSGHSADIEKEFEETMQRYAKEENFEKAAIIRDHLVALRDVKRNTRLVSEEDKSRDYIGIATYRDIALAYLLKVREKRLFAKEEYSLTKIETSSTSEIASSVLRSIYTHTYDIPEEIIVSVPIEDAQFFIQWFEKYREKKVKIVWKVKGERKRLLDLVQKNAEISIMNYVPEKKIPTSLLELQKYLNLPEPPTHIEGVDISNIQGKSPTGSIVVATKGRLNKSEYRKYKIEKLDTPNDFAMTEEVLERRLKRLLNEGKPLPSLILLDGGKGQLSAGLKVLEKLNIDIPIFGFAKTTDHLYGKDGKEITIPGYSQGLKLLKKIRDEAHRFAIAFHRKTRKKSAFESELDRIPGIGKKRKKILLEYFGSVKNIKKASINDIARVPGLGLKFSEKIYEFFHPE